MRQQSIAGLRCAITGGMDREGGGDGPCIVLLHGYGAPGTDLVGLWRALSVPQETRFVFPEAPISLVPAGGSPMMTSQSRAWWHIDMVALERATLTGEPRDWSGMVPEGLVPARETMVSFLIELDAVLGFGDRLVLGGFSQGAMLAMDTALHTDRPLAGLALLSGTLLNEAEWRARMGARRGLRVFQSHGERDPLLPFVLAERLRDLMMGSGLDVTWTSFRGAHEIPQTVRERLAPFLKEVLCP